MALNLQLGKAIGIVARTAPYLVYRALVYGACCAAVAFALLVLALIGKVFGGAAAVILFVLALIGGGFGARLLREYVLYVLKAGHVALIAELATNGKLPDGVSQTAWARQRVVALFKEISALALVDQLVRGVIQTVNRTVFRVMDVLPLPGAEGAKNLAGRVVDASLTYVDESILAHAFRTRSDDVFGAAKQGIVLYCMAWRGLLKNAVVLTLLGYALTVVTAVLFLVPLGVVAWTLPADWQLAKLGVFVLALFLGFSVKWVIFDPIACASTVLTFFAETEGVEPDREWEARLAAASDSFRELQQRALDALRTAVPAEAGPDDPTVVAPRT
jgi:hypothetical protein